MQESLTFEYVSTTHLSIYTVHIALQNGKWKYLDTVVLELVVAKYPDGAEGRTPHADQAFGR